MTYRFAIAGSLGAALALAGPAAHAAVPAQVAPGHYTVEPGHTQAVFSLSHFGFTEYSGMFSGASGTLDLDPANPRADRLDVSVPVSSVLTTSPKLNDELKGAQWFDTARFPDARFVSTAVTRTGPAAASVAGDLTLHGVTRPVVLAVRFVGSGVNPLDKSNTVGFSATTTIRRSAFGVSQYVPMVGDDVRLTIAGAFVRG